jgi:hypothetical protein
MKLQWPFYFYKFWTMVNYIQHMLIMFLFKLHVEICTFYDLYWAAILINNKYKLFLKLK